MKEVIGYRVKTLNSPENRVAVPFPDLCAKFSSGYVLPLQVREGDEVPLDVLDPEDVRKSLKVGSLRRYLDLGRIEAIYAPDPEPVVIPVVEVKPVPNVPSVPVEATLPVAENPVTPAVPTTEVREEKASVDQSPITDLSLVKTFEDFNRLSYFMKLRFIKESKDVALLKEISSRTTSSQFKNNIQLRLS